MRSIIAFTALLLAAQSSAALAQQPTAASESLPGREPNPHRHALLIGVTRYLNLSDSHHLQGPAGDAIMFGRLLRDKLGFPAEQVVELTETAGAKSNDHLPTRANIERAFRELSERCKAGDYAVIFLAGHGSQQPATEKSAKQELDGLDEVFLPRDAAAWDSDRGLLPGAIVDDELQGWVAAVQAKGASVCLIVDSCHSGTMLRGPAEKVRQITPRELGIPALDLAKAREDAARRNPLRTRGGDAPKDAQWQMAGQPGVIAIYACQPEQVTVEEKLPRQAASAEPHGLFSYSFCQALTQAIESSTKPLTYRELVGRVRRKYAELGRDTPSPLVEGSDLDKEVFGDRSWPGRSAICLVAEDRINAGAVQGLTEESVLAVYAAEGDERPLGHVRVIEVRAFDAEVIPCEHDKMPEPASLPKEAVCRVVYVDRGSQRLRVAVDQQDSQGQALDAMKQGQLTAVLNGLGKGERALIQPVAEIAKAEWIVRPGGGEVVLVPAQRWAGQPAAATNPAFGPFAIDAKLEATLRDRLERIGRATSLVRLAMNSADSPLRSRDALSLGVELSRRDQAGLAKLPWQDGGLDVYDGDQLVLTIQNANAAPADISVLFVDSQYGITSLFPADGEDNRLPPGKTKAIDDLTIKVDTIGQEYLVIVGVRGETSERVDLSVLEQPNLELARRKAATRGGKSLTSPLGELLSSSLYGIGRTRGESRSSLKSYSINAIPWKTVGEKRDGKLP